MECRYLVQFRAEHCPDGQCVITLVRYHQPGSNLPYFRIFTYAIICRSHLLGGYRRIDDYLPLKVLDVLDKLLEISRF